MKQKATTFTLSMIGLYLLITFILWQLDPSMWTAEVRAMYALFAPIFSFLVSNRPSDL